MVVEYDHEPKLEECCEEKDEKKESKSDSNFNNEIMLSNLINDNAMKHQYLSMPGIFI